MVWRSRQDGSQNRPETALPELVLQLESGSAAAETRLHASFNAAEEEPADAILDALASSAAAGSPYSLELLLGLVAENRLAAPAIGRHVNSHTVAEEVEQEVLIAVARSIHRYRGDAKFTTWLYSVARNTAITEIRRQQPTVVIDDRYLDHMDQRRVSSLVAERDLLRDAIYSLPPIFRETVLLRDVERLSYSEIAERQGLAINTVRSRLSRGRALLAALLPDQRSNR
ncbi:MAG: sigma-70 family RNA polymerase sigma factor [Acidimicrobiales bacterium]